MRKVSWYDAQTLILLMFLVNWRIRIRISLMRISGHEIVTVFYYGENLSNNFISLVYFPLFKFRIFVCVKHFLPFVMWLDLGHFRIRFSPLCFQTQKHKKNYIFWC
jgi:hypothetical protein